MLSFEKNGNKKVKELKKEVKDKFEELQSMASACLVLPEFKLYKKAYENLYTVMMQKFLNIAANELETEWMMFKEMQAYLKIYGDLISRVERDAGKESE